MPFQKGNKIATGRPEGSKNKRTLMVEEIAAKVGCDPFEVLMRMAAGDWEGLGYESECYFAEKAEGDGKVITKGYVITPEMRLTAAKDASKYLYSQKQSMALSNADGQPLRIEVVRYISKKE